MPECSRHRPSWVGKARAVTILPGDSPIQARNMLLLGCHNILQGGQIMAYRSNVRQENAAHIQQVMAEQAREDAEWPGETLAHYTGLRPDEINDAVALMVQRGHAACDYSEGRRPYAFASVRLTSEGRGHYERRSHA
jgi:hypothetical protein